MNLKYHRINTSLRKLGGGGLVAKSCPTLVTPWSVACQDPLSMGILQAGILEWINISFSIRKLKSKTNMLKKFKFEP